MPSSRKRAASARHRAEIDEQMSRIASLGEPVRRDLYRYVAAQPEPVSREQAAAAVGVARHVAKFHLDRLEADGLLSSEYRRPAGRGGPGAGRPSKWYRRAGTEISVSLPERRYDLAAHVMAEAIEHAGAGGSAVAAALRESAFETGRQLGRAARGAANGTAEATASSEVVQALDVHGFEPRRATECIELANCPFHQLAARYTELVCGMNLELINGVLAELEPHDLTAALEPGAGRCCVRIHRRE